jgi:hypothetical protein
MSVNYEFLVSILMIAGITAGLVWYGVVLAHREDREAESARSANTKPQKLPIAS